MPKYWLLIQDHSKCIKMWVLLKKAVSASSISMAEYIDVFRFGMIVNEWPQNRMAIETRIAGFAD